MWVDIICGRHRLFCESACYRLEVLFKSLFKRLCLWRFFLWVCFVWGFFVIITWMKKKRSLLLTAQCSAIGIAICIPNRSADLGFSLECLLLIAAACIYAKIWFTNQQFSLSFKVVGKLTLQGDDNFYCCIKMPHLTCSLIWLLN